MIFGVLAGVAQTLVYSCLSMPALVRANQYQDFTVSTSWRQILSGRRTTTTPVTGFRASIQNIYHGASHSRSKSDRPTNSDGCLVYPVGNTDTPSSISEPKPNRVTTPTRFEFHSPGGPSKVYFEYTGAPISQRAPTGVMPFHAG